MPRAALSYTQFTFQTTNEFWQECVLDASVKTVFKVSVTIDSIQFLLTPILVTESEITKLLTFYVRELGEDIIDNVTENHK